MKKKEEHAKHGKKERGFAVTINLPAPPRALEHQTTASRLPLQVNKEHLTLRTDRSELDRARGALLPSLCRLSTRTP